MPVTAELLRKISKGKPVAANVAAIVMALNEYGPKYGLDQPHRQAHYLAQLAHESGGFFYDKEIASGAAYEGRKDLGNTQKGDGKRFKGRGPIQVTGRANYTAFGKWAGEDFLSNPDKVNTDPWEGLTAIWYWDAGNPEGKSLNRYADKNDIQMITRRINGGLNGYEDRLDYYDRAALALLGEPVNIKAFQQKAGLAVDGVSGPQTRAEMHKRLVHLTDKPARSEDVAAAPVVAKETVAVPVKELQTPAWQSPEVLIPAAAPVATGVSTFLSGADWRVAIAVVVVVAAFAAFLIIRRDRMKTAQAAKVDTINAKSSL